MWPREISLTDLCMCSPSGVLNIFFRNITTTAFALKVCAIRNRCARVDQMQHSVVESSTAGVSESLTGTPMRSGLSVDDAITNFRTDAVRVDDAIGSEDLQRLTNAHDVEAMTFGAENRENRHQPSIRSAKEVADLSPDSHFDRQNAHACSVLLVEQLLETNIITGLTTQEATARLAKYGLNKLAEAKPESMLSRIWRQLNEILTWILLASALVSGSLQSWPEFVLIIIVIIINITIGLVQEGKAAEATKALKNMLSTKATVIRNGMRMEIDTSLVVPGDIIFLESGNKVPADLRLFRSENLGVQEAMLTGESLPAAKGVDAVGLQTTIADRTNICYSATLVVRGQGAGICVATGDTTEIGRIAELVTEVQEKRSNLLRQIDAFGRWIGCIVIPAALTTFLIAFLTPIDLTGETSNSPPSNKTSDKAKEAVIITVAVSVSIIPAGLQAIITICMAVAVKHMARNHAIVKTLPSVEVLGNVMVICSDKTGTLTKNEMTVVAVRTQSSHYKVDGVGYDATGANELANTEDVAFKALIRGGVLNNESRLEKTVVSNAATLVTAIGDPTECALLCLAEKDSKINIDALKKEHRRVGVIPFESAYKFMITFHALPQDENSYLVVVKGAPDRLIPKCAESVTAEGSRVPCSSSFWSTQVNELSSNGYRCLAICETTISCDALPSILLQGANWIVDAQVPFLTLQGVVGILDPPREECVQAIREAHGAGINVKMITGDHPATAKAIGRMLGLVDDTHSNVVTGNELDGMSLAKLEEIVDDCNIFARASPDNKISIVRALQNRGKICSMTGDGVNDAPALRAADVGVAMGITGSDVSKDAAKIVLANDNFATILVAVKQGRRVYDNLRKIIIFNMPANFAQGGIIFFAVCLQWSVIPLTAIQVLYVNMVGCCTLGLVLAIEPEEPTVMRRPPRRIGKGFIGRFFYWRVVYVSTMFILFALAGVTWIRGVNPIIYDAPAQRAVAFNCLVFCQCWYVLNCRFLHLSSIHPRIFRGNSMAWICITMIIAFNFGITYIPGLNTFFSVKGMDGFQWGIVLFFSLTAFFMVELEKLLAPHCKPFTGPVIDKVLLGCSGFLGLCVPNCCTRYWTPEPQHAKSMQPSDQRNRQGGSLRPISFRKLMTRTRAKSSRAQPGM